MKDGPWQLYILRCGDGTLYTGIAVDAEKRLRQHRSGKGAKYTRGRGPLEMAMMQGLTSAIVNPNDLRLMETIKSCDIFKNNELYSDSYLDA